MVTRFQRAIQQGNIDVTNFLPGNRFKAPTGFRVVAQPKRGAFGTRDELNRFLANARRTGTFPSAKFVGLFQVSNIGAFNERQSRLQALSGQKLQPSTLKALTRQGQITRQQASALARGQRQTTPILRQRVKKTKLKKTTTSIFKKTTLSSSPSAFKDLLLRASREASVIRRRQGKAPATPPSVLTAEANLLDFRKRVIENINRLLEAEKNRLESRTNVSNAQINAFNKKIDEQRRRVNTFNQRVIDFNKKLPVEAKTTIGELKITPEQKITGFGGAAGLRVGGFGAGFKPSKFDVQLQNSFNKLSTISQKEITRVATEIQSGLRVGGSNAAAVLIAGREFIIGRLTSNQQKNINNSLIRTKNPTAKALANLLFIEVNNPKINKNKFNQAVKDLGGAAAQTGAVFLPGGAGAIAISSSLIANAKPVDAGINFGIGLLFGVASVFLGKGSKLVRLFLGTGKAGKVYVVAEKTTAGVIIPLYFAVQSSRAAGQIVEASIRGERQRVKDLSTQTAADFAAFRVGTGTATGLTERIITPVEGRLILAATILKLSKPKQNQFKKYFELAQEFAKLKTKPSNPKTSVAERIPTKAGQIIDKFIIGKGVLGGSLAQYFQVPLRIRLKLPKPSDVDFYGRGNTWRTNARALFLLLQKANIPRTSLLIKGAKAEITINGKKAIEFHSINKLIQNIREARALFSLSSRSIITSPNGTKMLKLSLQAKRKIIGGFTDNRTKDIVQFEVLAKALTPAQRKAALKRAKERGVVRVSFSGLLPSINLKLSTLLKLVSKNVRIRINSMLSQLRKAIGTKALKIANKLKALLKSSLRTVTKNIQTKVKQLKIRLSRASIKAKALIRKRIAIEIRLLKKLQQEEAGYLRLLTVGKKKPKTVKRKVKITKKKIKTRRKKTLKKTKLKQSKAYNHYFKQRRRSRTGRIVFSYRKLNPNKRQQLVVAQFYNVTGTRRARLPARVTIQGVSYPKAKIVRTRLVFVPGTLYTTNLVPRYPPLPTPTRLPPGYPTKPPTKTPGYPPSKKTTITPPPRKPGDPPIILLPNLSFIGQVNFLRKSKGAFNVLVRTKVKGKRKFRRMNAKPITGKSALALGQKITDNDPRRSFFISKAKGKPKKLRLKPFNLKRYRKPIGKSKLPVFSFVEKSAFAISSKGERRGITAKGLRAKRLKKTVKRKQLKRRTVRRRKPVRRLRRKVIRRRPTKRKRRRRSVVFTL